MPVYDLPLDLLILGIASFLRMPGFFWFTFGEAALIMAALIAAILFVWNMMLRKSKDAAKLREKALMTQVELIDKLGRLKVELYQNMYHDIKTPLTVLSTSILNIADMIEYGDIDEDEMLKILDHMQSETMYMSRMLDNVMRLSSAPGGKHDLLFVPMDIGTFIAEKSEVYRILLARNKNKLSLDIAPALPKVLACADMILHVLINLLTNANRYTRAGEVYISVSHEEDSVRIVVGDNGSGIKKEILPHIFERGTSDGSTGLGLAICKAVVENTHGGKISAESEVGVGTKIMFTLPTIKAN